MSFCVLTFTEVDMWLTYLLIFFPRLVSRLPLTVMEFRQWETWDPVPSCWTPLLHFWGPQQQICQMNTAQTVHPRPPSVFGDFQNPRLRNCYAFRAVQRGRLHGSPSCLLSLALSLVGVSSGLYFGTASMMDPCLFPETIFFSLLSRIFKS